MKLNIGVEDGSGEFARRGLERVVMGKFDVNAKSSTFVWCVFRTIDLRLPFAHIAIVD